MSKVPDFSTTVDLDMVDITIRAEDLLEAGWVYGGVDDKDIPAVQEVVAKVKNWHDATHQDVWRWCPHDLCRELRR